MSQGVKGRVTSTRVLVTRGAYTRLDDLKSGWYNITPENTGMHWEQTDENVFDRTARGRFCPRDETRSLYVPADIPGLTFYIPAGGTVYLEHVIPMFPYVPPANRRE